MTGSSQKDHRWTLIAILGVLGLISAAVAAWITSELTSIPKGFSSAPTPSTGDTIKMVLSWVMAFLFGGGSITGLIVQIWNKLKPNYLPDLPQPITPSPVNPLPSPVIPQPLPVTPQPQPDPLSPSALVQDTLLAFHEWIKDLLNPVKRNRFLLDLVQLGLVNSTSDKMRAWLMEGMELLKEEIFSTTGTVTGQSQSK